MIMGHPWRYSPWLTHDHDLPFRGPGWHLTVLFAQQ
jgi:hypothetical protein